MDQLETHWYDSSRRVAGFSDFGFGCAFRSDTRRPLALVRNWKWHVLIDHNLMQWRFRTSYWIIEGVIWYLGNYDASMRSSLRIGLRQREVVESGACKPAVKSFWSWIVALGPDFYYIVFDVESSHHLWHPGHRFGQWEIRMLTGRWATGAAVNLSGFVVLFRAREQVSSKLHTTYQYERAMNSSFFITWSTSDWLLSVQLPGTL